jgi:hypothetical protein
MAHYLTSDDEYRGPSHGDGGESHQGGNQFRRDVKRGQMKYAVGRSALDRVNGYFKTLIAAIANAKLRRMRRELELRGIRLDQADEVWIASSLREDNRST